MVFMEGSRCKNKTNMENVTYGAKKQEESSADGGI